MPCGVQARLLLYLKYAKSQCCTEESNTPPTMYKVGILSRPHAPDKDFIIKQYLNIDKEFIFRGHHVPSQSLTGAGYKKKKKINIK